MFSGLINKLEHWHEAQISKYPVMEQCKLFPPNFTRPKKPLREKSF